MKTSEQLHAEAAENEMFNAERAYVRARQNLDYVSVHGSDKEFSDAWTLTEMTRNNLNWLRKVREKNAAL